MSQVERGRPIQSFHLFARVAIRLHKDDKVYTLAFLRACDMKSHAVQHAYSKTDDPIDLDAQLPICL